MELDINAGAGIGMDLSTRRVYTPQQAVTEHILTLAGQAGYGAALIDAVADGPDGACVVTWPQFVHMVRAAAGGLSRRGLREADAAAIFVQNAVSHVVAVHAVRAAGAHAAPIRPAQAAADIAAQLKGTQARLLITSAGLAELAIEAAERSCVRQVFAFGEAEGTMPFGSLLHTARHGQHDADGSTSHNGNGHDGSRAVAHVRDLYGPRPNRLELNGLGLDGLGLDGLGLDRAALDGLGLGLDGLRLGLDGSAPRLTRRDVVVAAPPCGDPDAYTSLLDLALAVGATIVAAPLPQVAAAVGAYKGTAAIVPRGTDVPGLPGERVFTID